MQTDELLEAVRKNNTERVLQLLDKQPSLSEARDPTGVSVIFLALYRGNKRAATAIAERNPNLDIFEAAAIGNTTHLRKLVDRDSSLVKSHSPDGFTALALAAYLGQKDSAEFLVEHGADLNAVAKNDTGFTALTGAVTQNHNQIAKLLVEHGADVNHRYEGGFTPLMHAAYAGNVELVTFLIDKGADPNARNSEGKTVLMFSQEKGNQRITDLLKSHGAV